MESAVDVCSHAHAQRSGKSVVDRLSFLMIVPLNIGRSQVTTLPVDPLLFTLPKELGRFLGRVKMSLGQGVRHFCSRWLSANSFGPCWPSPTIAIKVSLFRDLAKFAIDVKVGDGERSSYQSTIKLLRCKRSSDFQLTGI